MKSYTTLVLGALFASLQNGAEAFSPAASGSSLMLKNLKEMRMTGAGGAASPDDNYYEGESVGVVAFTWN